MPNSSLTLAVLSGLDPDVEGIALSAADQHKLATELRDQARQFKGLSGFDLGERLLGHVAESLRTPVAAVLGEVWKQRKELRDAARRGDKEHEVEGEVELYDHSISGTIHPAVQVQWNGKTLATLTLDVKVRLELKAVQLVIRNACITSVVGGTLQSTISYEYQTIPILPPYPHSVDLPGRLDLPGDGIRLA